MKKILREDCLNKRTLIKFSLANKETQQDLVNTIVASSLIDLVKVLHGGLQELNELLN